MKKYDTSDPNIRKVVIEVPNKMPVRPIDANALMEKIRFREGPVMGQREIFLIEGEPTLSLNTLRDAIYQDAVEHGLWEDVEKDACELSEEEPHLCMKDGEVEYYRRYYASKLVFFEGDELLLAAEDDDFEGLKEELADVVIQAFSTAGYLGIDIDAAIRRKMEINKSRPWKHGKE